jgi:hypothetical protein
MKKIKKIGGLAVLSFLSFVNICFADIIFPGQSPEGHGVQYYHDPEPIVPTSNVLRYIGIGVLVLAIAICAIIIIKRTIKNKKEKSNDNK